MMKKNKDIKIDKDYAKRFLIDLYKDEILKGSINYQNYITKHIKDNKLNKRQSVKLMYHVYQYKNKEKELLYIASEEIYPNKNKSKVN